MDREEFLAAARSLAEEIAEVQGFVTIDHVRWVAERRGIEPHHPNAWGGVFRSRRFRACGWMRSSRPAARRRWIQVWGLN